MEEGKCELDRPGGGFGAADCSSLDNEFSYQMAIGFPPSRRLDMDLVSKMALAKK